MQSREAAVIRGQGLERLGPGKEVTSTPRPSCCVLPGEWPGLEMEQARGHGGSLERWTSQAVMIVCSQSLPPLGDVAVGWRASLVWWEGCTPELQDGFTSRLCHLGCATLGNIVDL